MSVHRVAVISDTHSMLRPEVIDELEKAEVVLHAGDVNSQDTLDKLREINEIKVVRGNCDREWAENLPKELFFELFGKKIYMVHNKKDISSKADEADIIIYGHSHKYEEIEEDKILLNPGSAGARRFGRPVSMAVLEIDSETGNVEIEKIDLS